MVIATALVLPVTVASAASPGRGAERRHVFASAISATAGIEPRYAASITRTQGGIPHIVGANFGDVGYGYGYAFAQDNICTMAADYVTVEGRRSFYFGPAASYQQRANGVTVSNLDSDVFWAEVRDSGIVGRLTRQRPPLGLLPGVRAVMRGYVAGYDRYLRSVGGADGITDPACHGKPWVQPITIQDAYLRLYQLVLMASSDVLMPAIAEAAPPTLTSPISAAVNVRRTATLIAEGWKRAMAGMGSNGIAVGKAGTRDHTHGLLIGNPHFPWIGTERFYDAQITIPGRLNASGASLFGVPLVLVGHNKWVAWTHTVSTAFEFTPYELSIVAGEPTEYYYDGAVMKMRPRTVTVAERVDGKVTKVSHTLWWTRYGPMITSLEGVPLPWTAATGFTFRDANATNLRVYNHFPQNG